MDIFLSILQHTGLVLFYLLLFALDVLIFAGVPGGWVAFAGIVIWDIATGFSTVGWPLLIVMAGLLTVGEIVESLLGVVYVAKKGASKWGVLGAFIGGLVGAIVGSAALPFVGTVLGALAGAFLGAVALEYAYYNSMDEAMKTGFAAFVGKLAAFFVKLALSLVVLGIFIWRSWG
ncbi:MAG: DUF456 domain-containing protein [Candidatus Krumholzibacteriota bacterium]|nr:DUF456 domain-containing protein [Candidatus Krumholzibacteriota bacterium]